jgi:hypothetical protein
VRLRRIDDDHFLDRRLEQGGVGGEDAGLASTDKLQVLFPLGAFCFGCQGLVKSGLGAIEG